jgi:hypothetical protein
MDTNTIAALESRIDYLETELSYLNKILVKCGFSEGITTLKMTVEEMLMEQNLVEESY